MEVENNIKEVLAKEILNEYNINKRSDNPKLLIAITMKHIAKAIFDYENIRIEWLEK